MAFDDVPVHADGTWSCRHVDGPTTTLADLNRPVTCPDCGTVWVPWTHGVRRLAKPVVVRIDR